MDKTIAAKYTAAEIYFNAIESEAVRVLGLMDRETFSPTFGCLDRTYWAWKFIDFPGARFQEGLCVLSFLFTSPLEGNGYCGQPKLFNWIAGGFDFWSRIQYQDGSFDEAYPFERSLAATAFTAFYLSEAWHLLDGRLPLGIADRFKRSLEKAGDWLIKNDEKHGFLTNHLAAAAAALYHIYMISGESRFETRSRYFINKILEHQSKEGWYEEYGGADPGYQTHGSFYLARYLELSGDLRVAESLERSFIFLAHFVHPDGSLGGEYASRNTQTYYPAAFEMMSHKSGTSRWIAERMTSSVHNLAAAGLNSVDVYNYFPLLNNYVFAYLACQKPGHRSASSNPQSPDAEMIHFPEAGLLKIRSDRYDLYVGLSKGGVNKVFDRRKNQLVLNDCGYMGRLKDGNLISSQWANNDRDIRISSDEIIVEGHFYQINKPVLNSISFIGFRVFSLTLGRLPGISYWLKSLLVSVLIYRKRKLNLRFKRSIRFHSNEITVQDYIQGNVANRIEQLVWVDIFTTIHMGSSRYFLPNELNTYRSIKKEQGLEIDPAGIMQGISIERTVTF